MLVKANDKQICTLFLKEVKYCLYLPAFYDRAGCPNAMFLRQLCRFSCNSP
jgi:hypothetical protein